MRIGLGMMNIFSPASRKMRKLLNRQVQRQIGMHGRTRRGSKCYEGSGLIGRIREVTQAIFDPFYG